MRIVYGSAMTSPLTNADCGTRCTKSGSKSRQNANARKAPMARSPIYKPYLDTEQALSGFSSIAPHFWRTAEKLRDEAVKVTAGQSQPMNWTVHSAICLYHTALDCFINEEIAIN